MLRAIPWISYSAADLTYKALMALYWVLLARSLEPSAVGEIALATAVATPVFVLADAGATQYLIKAYQPAGREGQRAGLSNHDLQVLRGRVVQGSLGIPLVALVSGAVSTSLTAAAVGLLVGTAFYLEFCGLLLLAPARARKDPLPELGMRTIQSAGSLFALAVILLAFRSEATLLIAGGLLVAYVCAVAVPLAAWLREQHAWALDQESPPRVAPEVRAFGQANVAMTLWSRADALVVQMFMGAAALAAYSLAVRLVEVARLIPTAIARSTVAVAAHGRGAGRQRELRTHLFASVGIGTVSAAILLVFGPHLLVLLFGTEYGGAASSVQILAASVLAAGLSAPLEGYLLAAGEAFYIRRVAVEAGCAGGVLMLALTPAIGLDGAATGISAAYALTAARYAFKMNRRLGRHSAPTGVPHHA